MLVKPWNYHFFEARALDAFSNLPSSSRHVPMFPLFYPLSKEAPTFSPSRDETKFIFLLPLLTNRIREKIPERGGCIFENIITNIFETFKDLQERLQLRLGRINPSPSREPDIWGGRRKSQSHDTKSILRSAENWRGGVVESWWRPFKRNLNVSSIFPLDSVTKLITRDRKLAFPKSWPNWTRPTFEKSIPFSLYLSLSLSLSPSLRFLCDFPTCRHFHGFFLFPFFPLPFSCAYPKWKRRDREHEKKECRFGRSRLDGFHFRERRGKFWEFWPVTTSEKKISIISIHREVSILSVVWVISEGGGRGNSVFEIRIRDKLD